jgi:hypothetical protein
MVPHSSILMCYWFSCDLIAAYLCVIDWHVTSFQHSDVLLILMWPRSCILKYYWFLWYLIPVYWCAIDSHVTSFQHTDLLLIFMWPHSSILMCYWFLWYFTPAYWCYWLSCDLIPACWSVIDSHVSSFQRTNVLLILMWPPSSILILLIIMWPYSSILMC